jgi:hypothetical protein
MVPVIYAPEAERDLDAITAYIAKEDIELPNPVIRSHYGNGFIKQYVRDHLLLRTEPATNNVNDYGVKKAVENLPKLRQRLESITDDWPKRRAQAQP